MLCPDGAGDCRAFPRAINTNRTNFMAEKSIEEKVKDIIVELVMAFEEEFSVEVPDEDAEKLQTVGDVIKYIEERAKPQ